MSQEEWIYPLADCLSLEKLKIRAHGCSFTKFLHHLDRKLRPDESENNLYELILIPHVKLAAGLRQKLSINEQKICQADYLDKFCSMYDENLSCVVKSAEILATGHDVISNFKDRLHLIGDKRSTLLSSTLSQRFVSDAREASYVHKLRPITTKKPLLGQGVNHILNISPQETQTVNVVSKSWMMNVLSKNLEVDFEPQQPIDIARASLKSCVSYVSLESSLSTLLFKAVQIRPKSETFLVFPITIGDPLLLFYELWKLKRNIVALKESDAKIHILISVLEDNLSEGVLNSVGENLYVSVVNDIIAHYVNPYVKSKSKLSFERTISEPMKHKYIELSEREDVLSNSFLRKVHVQEKKVRIIYLLVLGKAMNDFENEYFTFGEWKSICRCLYNEKFEEEEIRKAALESLYFLHREGELFSLDVAQDQDTSDKSIIYKSRSRVIDIVNHLCIKGETGKVPFNSEQSGMIGKDYLISVLSTEDEEDEELLN